MNTYFETTQAARLRTARKTQKLTAGVQKPKRHVGKLGNYLFDRDAFLKFIEALPSGSKVSWRDLGIRFQVKNKSGLRPSNAGQVLMEAAKSLGIDVSKFNTEKRISGRDYAQRIRRARHKLMYQKVSIPASQPTRKLHTEIRRRMNNQEIYVGELIAPKTYRRNHITSSGDLEETEVTVHGRKIPLEHIRRQMNVDQGLLFRWRKDDYENLDEETILKRFSKLKIPVPSEPMSALDELMKLEHTRNLKVWHDHSDILNHSYVSFMISALYDTAVYLRDEEFKERYPDRTPVDVQSAVEKPYLYILAIYDVLRVFSGNGPARQFEAGHQRGGNFSCLCGISVKEHQNLECALRFHPPTLSERMKILKSGVLWKEYSERNINPLYNLKKEALTDELEARGVDTYGKSAAEMKEKLVEILHGIQRPPALLSSDIHFLSLSRYEIPPCEPLHDLSNIVQNLITELPTHIEDNKVQVDFEKFANATIGDKNQLKGSDARLFAVKLAKFAHQKFTENGIPKEILLLCTSLVEMISICYSHHHQMTPKTILRLYNQSFLFSVLCKTVIGTPKKMTTRKFYGCHFHSMTVHAPQTFRIFCLRSLIPEQEERSFGDMRRISLNTSSRQCGKIIDNAIVRFNAQQQSDRGDNYRRQESAISQQARLLPTDSIKILDNCWSKCVSAFEKGEIQLPLLKVKIFDGSKPKIIRNENLLAQNQAQCLLTGKSGQRADEDHESEREEESADSQMQLVSGGLVAINRISIHTEENQESTRYSKIVDLGAEAVDCNENTAQGTKHYDMDRPPLIPLLHNTDPRSACESVQQMIDASQDVEKGSSACISLLQNTGRQSRKQSVKVKPCKRKLFDENRDKESMSKKILLLLPDHPTLTEYSCKSTP
uniref:Uncharacterized protein n=1 Tax=Magallana gigas TaxID=29159 RepID=A0A8W8L0T5_MAGGI